MGKNENNKQKPDHTKDRKIHEKQFDSEISEDVTAYGEFLCSYFTWITPSRQKQRAEQLNEMTKNKDKKK